MLAAFFTNEVGNDLIMYVSTLFPDLACNVANGCGPVDMGHGKVLSYPVNQWVKYVSGRSKNSYRLLPG
jgi:hypothetical protein